MLLVAKNIISDSNLFFYLYNFSQSTTFEYNSFAGCKSLKTIDFKNVEFIGIGAFQETALYSVTFPQTLQIAVIFFNLPSIILEVQVR